MESLLGSLFVMFVMFVRWVNISATLPERVHEAFTWVGTRTGASKPFSQHNLGAVFSAQSAYFGSTLDTLFRSSDT